MTVAERLRTPHPHRYLTPLPSLGNRHRIAPGGQTIGHAPHSKHFSQVHVTRSPSHLKSPAGHTRMQGRPSQVGQCSTSMVMVGSLSGKKTRVDSLSSRSVSIALSSTILLNPPFPREGLRLIAIFICPLSFSFSPTSLVEPGDQAQEPAQVPGSQGFDHRGVRLPPQGLGVFTL